MNIYNIFLDPRIREDDSERNIYCNYSSFSEGISNRSRHPRECGDPVFIDPIKDEDKILSSSSQKLHTPNSSNIKFDKVPRHPRELHMSHSSDIRIDSVLRHPRECGDPFQNLYKRNTTMKTFYVYITCSKKNGTLYIGMTNDLTRRMQEHKNKLIKGFTKKYSVNLLVYYETFESIIDAIKREKQLKKWKREWKMHFIEKINPNWKDLSETDIFLDPRIREDDNKENMNFTYSSATNTDNFNIGSLPNSSDIKIDQVPRHPRECGDPVFIAPNKEENE